RLELIYQVAVHLEKVAGEGLALEQVRDLRLDALVAPGDRRNGGRRRDRAQKRVAQPVLHDALAQACPPLRIVRNDTPRVELQLSPRRSRLREGWVSPFLDRELHGGRERVKVDLLRNSARERPRFRA